MSFDVSCENRNKCLQAMAGKIVVGADVVDLVFEAREEERQRCLSLLEKAATDFRTGRPEPLYSSLQSVMEYDRVSVIMENCIEVIEKGAKGAKQEGVR